jgi:hypothetical protein
VARRRKRRERGQAGRLDIKDKLNVHFFMDIIILASWSIWITRNNKIFEGIHPSFNSWRTIYLQELRMVKYRVKKEL